MGRLSLRALLRSLGPAVLLCSVLLGACSGGGGSGSAGETRSPSPLPTQSTIEVLSLGQQAATAKGHVVVYAYDGSFAAPAERKQATPGDVFVAVDAEGCAGPTADEKTGISPQLFYLQIGRIPYYPVDPVRQPALHTTALAPGGCTRGWITFEIPPNKKPEFVLFKSTRVTAWRLP